MMSNVEVKKVFEVFEKLEHTSKISEKLQLLESIKDTYVFKKIVFIVYSDEIKTYISYKRLLTIPCGEKQEATFEEFLELVGMLSKRIVTGNKALEKIRYFFIRCDKFHCKWYKRILSKDLRINVGESLIKELYGENVISKFRTPMMAHNIRNLKHPEEILQKHDWIYEEKIDGLRCLTVFRDGSFQCYSRNGKRLNGIEKILANVLTDNAIETLNGWILDGEFYNKNWSKTMTSVFNSNIPNIEDIIKTADYNIFDIIRIDSYEKGEYNRLLLDRKKLLERAFKEAKLKKPFRLIPYKILKAKDATLKHVYSIADLYINRGFEGIILKNIKSVYICKRSYDWLKVKNIKTIDVLCIGVEKSYKKPNEIAALIFKYKGNTCKVASGLTDKDRKLFYEKPELVVNKIIEVQYQEESKDGCLRFPIFVRVRYDKEIPDA